jgi:hypothetical protein
MLSYPLIPPKSPIFVGIVNVIFKSGYSFLICFNASNLIFLALIPCSFVNGVLPKSSVTPFSSPSTSKSRCVAPVESIILLYNVANCFT